MNLVYVDDSGTDDPSPVTVVGAVIVHDEQYFRVDVRAGVIVETMLAPDRREHFVEFHATDLFGSGGAFKGLSEDARHTMIRALLGVFPSLGLSFVYGAIDKRKLKESAFGSASPQDLAFRLAVCGACDYLSTMAVGRLEGLSDTDAKEKFRIVTEPFLVIADDGDAKIKHILRESFRALRPMAYHKNADAQRLTMCHDDMYFGASKNSIGLQIADVCAHIMLRYFRDGTKDEFFEAIKPYTICARPKPIWDQCREFTKTHDEPPDVNAVTLGQMMTMQALIGQPPSAPTTPDEGQQ